MRGLEAVKDHSGAKNISENKYECVGRPSSLSRAPSIPSIGGFSASFGNLCPISERVNDSTQNTSAGNTPPAQTLPSSLPQIGTFYPISESANPQTENNF